MTTEVKKAVEIFNDQYSELTVVKVVKYDSNRYLVLAAFDPKKPDSNGNWYGVNVRTESAGAYSPLAELEKFIKLVQTQVVYER